MGGLQDENREEPSKATVGPQGTEKAASPEGEIQEVLEMTADV